MASVSRQWTDESSMREEILPVRHSDYIQTEVAYCTPLVHTITNFEEMAISSYYSGMRGPMWSVSHKSSRLLKEPVALAQGPHHGNYALVFRPADHTRD